MLTDRHVRQLAGISAWLALTTTTGVEIAFNLVSGGLGPGPTQSGRLVCEPLHLNYLQQETTK